MKKTKPKSKKRATKKKSPISQRHENLLKRISDNIRNGMSMGEAMKAEGYSDSYSKSPNHLKETESWQTLLGDKVQDKKLVTVLMKLLNHKSWRAYSDGLDKALKLKKHYGDITIKHELGELSDEELERGIAGVLAEAIEISTRKTKKGVK